MSKRGNDDPGLDNLAKKGGILGHGSKGPWHELCSKQGFRVGCKITDGLLTSIVSSRVLLCTSKPIKPYFLYYVRYESSHNPPCPSDTSSRT